MYIIVMYSIRNDFPKETKDFFKRLEDYVDTKLYFYGSVTRSDYYHGKSDIDIAIFTDNEYSIMNKLQHFLHAKRSAFDKVVWKLNGVMVYGYKIQCQEYTDLKCEIAIYNNEFKETIMKDISQYDVIPFYIHILLYILKTVYYTIPILPDNIYRRSKEYIFNKLMVNKKDTVFFKLKKQKKKNN